MTDITTTAKPPRARRKREAEAADKVGSTKAPTKLDRLEALLREAAGASIAELVAATGWQQHSVRGAIAGALKKRGHAIASEKTDGVRRYRIVAA